MHGIHSENETESIFSSSEAVFCIELFGSVSYHYTICFCISLESSETFINFYFEGEAGQYILNPLMPVFFEAENKRVRAGTKLAGGAAPHSVRPLAAAHCCIGVRARIQHHTGPATFIFSDV